MRGGLFSPRAYHPGSALSGLPGLGWRNLRRFFFNRKGETMSMMQTARGETRSLQCRIPRCESMAVTLCSLGGVSGI